MKIVMGYPFGSPGTSIRRGSCGGSVPWTGVFRVQSLPYPRGNSTGESFLKKNLKLDLKHPHAVDDGAGDINHLLPEYEKLFAQIAGSRAKWKARVRKTLSPDEKETGRQESCRQKRPLGPQKPNLATSRR